MHLNSYVLIPLGIVETDRAKLLGQTVETNIKYYSFESKEYAENACNLLNKLNDKYCGPNLAPANIVDFLSYSNKKSLKHKV